MGLGMEGIGQDGEPTGRVAVGQMTQVSHVAARRPLKRHVRPSSAAVPGGPDVCHQPPADLPVPLQVDRGRRAAALRPGHPPSDVATTTTDEGEEVPFVVREETGVIDRDQYRIAVLYQPGQPWELWAPQDGYNSKLVINHGASCDTGYAMATRPTCSTRRCSPAASP
jgi:hypothetical protein